MPGGTIEIAREVEHLSIRDERGASDRSLEPGIPDELLPTMHRAMPLSRRFDERLLTPQRQGRLGTFAPVKGQGAAQVGSAAALHREDRVVPSYRETAAAVWRGTPPVGPFPHIAGYNEGGRIPGRRNDPPVAIPVGTQTLHAVGIGYGMNVRRADRVVMTYCGDGATSEDDCHEAMNFAAVFQPPVVFLRRNNQWAISTPRARPGAFGNARAEGARAYGHRIVDGAEAARFVRRIVDALADPEEFASLIQRPSASGMRSPVSPSCASGRRGSGCGTHHQESTAPPWGGSAGNSRFAPLGSTATVGRRILGAKP